MSPDTNVKKTKFNNKYNTDKLKIKQLKLNGFCIVHIDNPTEDMCLIAVGQNEHSLQFIKKPSDNVCLKAIKKNGYAIKYIEKPTDKMKLQVVTDCGYCIRYIDNPTDEMKIIANNKMIESNKV